MIAQQLQQNALPNDDDVPLKTRLPPSGVYQLDQQQPPSMPVDQKTRLPPDSRIYAQRQPNFQGFYTVDLNQQQQHHQFHQQVQPNFAQSIPVHLESYQRNSSLHPSAHQQIPLPSQQQQQSVKFAQQEPSLSKSEFLQCRNCTKFVQSNVKYEFGFGSVLLSIFLAFIGLLVLGLLPLCIDKCKDCVHLCPSCGLEIGVKKFLIK